MAPLLPGELAGWGRAFVFTQLVEIPLYLAVMSLRRFAAWRPLWQRLAIAFLCSLVTHPVVWFVFPRIFHAYEDYVVMVIAAETFAVAVEAFILWRFRVGWAFVVSLIVNMSSMSLGFLCRALTDWV